MHPALPTRPDSWPSGPPKVASLPQEGPAPAPAAASEIKPCEGAQILAWVGPEVILAGDVIPSVNEALAQAKGRAPADVLEAHRMTLMRQRLNMLIETRLIYLDARRSIPADNFPRVEQAAGRHFEDTELKKLMKRSDVTSRQALDEKLRQMGSSLDREKQAFIQRLLAQQWIRQQVKFDEEITDDQMRTWYQDHLADFEHPARAQWEELTARYAKYPSRAEAHAAICRMGNQVMAGAPLAEVAKTSSDGSTAQAGGHRDWTTKGSLVSEVLDRAIFSLPVGKLSPVLESDTGFHIVRVLKREDAGRKPFAEVQTEIGEKIREERVRKQLQEYVTRLKQRTPVATVFDQSSQASN